MIQVECTTNTAAGISRGTLLILQYFGNMTFMEQFVLTVVIYETHRM